jgi:uncharacterized protein (DUF885 family)
MRRIIVTAACLVAASGALAEDDYAALLEKAVAAIEWDFKQNWAYTETRLSDNELWVGRYDPRIEEDNGWRLVSVDGRAPTAAQTEAFLDDKADDDYRPSAENNRVVRNVEPDSLELVEETDDYWLFSFIPDEDEDLVRDLQARLKIAKAGPYVESLTIGNENDVSPGFGTRLTAFLTQLEFAPAAEGGPFMPASVKVRIQGRALFVIPIDETEVVEFSDFEYASEIEALADEVLAAMLERNPEMATRYSIAGARHDRLFDNSRAALAEWQAREDAWLARLNAIAPPTEIGSRDWVSYGILLDRLEASVARRVCRSELWRASTATSWHTNLPFLFEVQPVDTPKHREQALARLGSVDEYIDVEIANLRLGLEEGYSAPRVTVESVPQQVRALVSDDSIFLNPATRANDPAFGEQVAAVYENEIVPAIGRYANFIEDVYLGEARDDIALSANSEGERCYPALVRAFTTIQPTADEIHELGLEQIARIRGEMRETIDAHFGGGSIEAFLRRVNNDPAFTFDSETAVLQHSLDALDSAKAAMPHAFGRLPRADVLIKPYPAFAQSGGGEYHSSSEDGTRPGIFYIAVTNPKERSRAAPLSTLYHETYPGHHLQGAIALELGDRVHPLARYLWNSGFGEGWALYSERLADELGLYNDPLDYIGLYSNQGARAARLVIDTGLHTKGWTRQQAVDYMRSNTTWTEIDIQNEVNRYISWPGQATAYMLGMLEIRRLRDLAEAELGARFDLRAFHDRVVGYGTITLPMLEASILAWIEEQR